MADSPLRRAILLIACQADQTGARWWTSATVANVAGTKEDRAVSYLTRLVASGVLVESEQECRHYCTGEGWPDWAATTPKTRPTRGEPSLESVPGIGDMLRQRRIDAGVTIGQVAKAIGCKPQTVWQIEKGRRPIPIRAVLPWTRVISANVEAVLAAAG